MDIKLDGDLSIWMEKRTKKLYVLVNGVKRYLEVQPCYCKNN